MNITALTLYHFPGSRSARVRWALHETYGEDYELKTLKLLEGQQYAPEFLEKNPNHSVPLLEISWDDGSSQTMLESTAMVEWLADAHPEKKLAPAPDLTRERADYLQMMQFAGSWMDSLLWQLRVHRDLLPETESDPKTIQRAMDKMALEIEPQLLGRLSKSEYICGDEFSAADILMGHNVNWARAYGLFQGDEFKAYVGRLAARPAFRSAFADVAPRS